MKSFNSRNFFIAAAFGALPCTFGPGAMAATCATSGLAITCAGSVNKGVKDATNGVIVSVSSGAAVATDSDDAIRVRGSGSSVTNNGTLTSVSGDGIDGGKNLTVVNNGTIRAGNKGVDAEEKNGLSLTNNGTIYALDKAIRNKDASGAHLTNNAGALIESETDEGFESGDNATVVNYGIIRASDDAIQVGEHATITNYGLIGSVLRGNADAADPQDGIDIDSGNIFNYGTIRSDDDAAIDFDASDVTSNITNYAGGVISGTYGILVEKGEHADETGVIPAPNVAAQIISNYGLIEGRNGLALDLGAGDDVLAMHAGATLTGGGDFGSGDDTLRIDGLFAGTLGTLTGALFDGGTGTDTLDFTSYLFSDISSVLRSGDGIVLSLGSGAVTFTLNLINWENFRFSGTTYSFDQIAAVAPVPLPAGVLMLGGAIAGLGMLRRRKA